MRKTILKYASIILLAFGLGTYYGWSTGLVDGRVVASGTAMNFVESYSKARMMDDVAARDKAIELYALRIGMEFTTGFSYSPVGYHFMHPKARVGLLYVAATHELNQDLASPWKEGENRTLFLPGTPEADHLERLKTQYSDVYSRIIDQRRAERKRFIEKGTKTEQTGAVRPLSRS